MHLVEHHAKIEIPLWRKSPIHRGRNRIVRPGALRVRAVGAEGAPSSGGAEKGILDVVVIGVDHIQVSVTAYFAPVHMICKTLLPRPFTPKAVLLIFVC